MTDRELLELAAKAAGIEVVGSVEKYIVQMDDRHIGGFVVKNQKGGDSAWNPLGDDGDALRLAVKLGLNVYIGTKGTDVELDENSDLHVCECACDPYAATRRAIVRAAANIGGQQCRT